MTFTLTGVFIIVCLFIFFGLVVFIGAPYVPSQKKYAKRVFDHVGLTADDTLVDIGSGDGIVLRVAANYGAHAVGYEINPLLVLISKLFSFHQPKVQVRLQNSWSAIFPKSTTIVYAFSVKRDEKKLRTLMQREADRLGRPLKLLCLGSPFKQLAAVDAFEAYYLYIFQPLQLKKA